jgi:hypothetical protein
LATFVEADLILAINGLLQDLSEGFNLKFAKDWYTFVVIVVAQNHFLCLIVHVERFGIAAKSDCEFDCLNDPFSYFDWDKVTKDCLLVLLTGLIVLSKFTPKCINDMILFILDLK